MNLEDKLIKLGLWYRFLEKENTIHTADASKVTGIDIHKITKNLVSKTNEDEYVLIIVPGDRRVDLKKAAKVLGVKNVRLMPYLEADKISGYSPGGTPSIGLKKKVRTVIDEDLIKLHTFYCGGGSRNRLLELRSKDVIRISNAIIAKISKP
jgi:Cys-tRNA(Pro)/Cys-tRNA(Cys) deacylase